MTANTTTPASAAGSCAERMAEIERNESRATKGPWEYVPRHIAESEPEVRVPDGWLMCCTASDYDAEFIAHARSDIPWLISELRAAQAEIAALQLHLEGAMEAAGHSPFDSRSLSFTILRMRAVVDAARSYVLGHQTEYMTMHHQICPCLICTELRALDATEGKQT